MRLPLWASRNFTYSGIGLPRGGKQWSLSDLGDEHADIHMTINWTDQVIRAVRDAPQRSHAARELSKKVGVGQ